MKVNGIHYQSVWADFEKKEILIINQAILPFRFEIKHCKSIDDVIEAIQRLEVRGAPALGIMAAYAIWLSYATHHGQVEPIEKDYRRLVQTRPTAVNLKAGADAVFTQINLFNNESEVFHKARLFVENELCALQQIGIHGVQLIEKAYATHRRSVNILTHCNAGWLACGDYGTALAPIFEAHHRGIPVHVWVDETRPLNQGSRLTAWELYQENIPFHIISDNTAGQLTLRNEIDMVLVGADRIVKNGDMANKIGTYLKALMAYEHNIPFYVAAPSSTFDFSINNGNDIRIEERNPNELIYITAEFQQQLIQAKLCSEHFPALNLAFDITPAKFISAYITEKGIFKNISEITL